MIIVPIGWGHLTVNLRASVGFAKEFVVDAHKPR